MLVRFCPRSVCRSLLLAWQQLWSARRQSLSGRKQIVSARLKACSSNTARPWEARATCCHRPSRTSDVSTRPSWNSCSGNLPSRRWKLCWPNTASSQLLPSPNRLFEQYKICANELPYHVTSASCPQPFWQSYEDLSFQPFLSKLSVVPVKWLVHYGTLQLLLLLKLSVVLCIHSVYYLVWWELS